MNLEKDVHEIADNLEEINQDLDFIQGALWANVVIGIIRLIGFKNVIAIVFAALGALVILVVAFAVISFAVDIVLSRVSYSKHKAYESRMRHVIDRIETNRVRYGAASWDKKDQEEREAERQTKMAEEQRRIEAERKARDAEIQAKADDDRAVRERMYAEERQRGFREQAERIRQRLQQRMAEARDRAEAREGKGMKH